MAERSVDDVIAEALAERDVPRRRRLLAYLVPPPTLSVVSARNAEAALKNEADIAHRLAATDVLAAVGDAALPLLLALLKDVSPGVRRLAVDTLGLIPSPGALKVLQAAADDVSPAVRAAALDSVARIGGPGAIAALTRQLDDAATPPSVALAALLGIEQLNAVLPSGSLQRWLGDPLTVGATLRLLGRCGDPGSILPSLKSTSATRQRAAVLGMAEALERGATAPPQLLEPETRAQLAWHVEKGDWTSASAALIILAHIGDIGSLEVAAARDDRTRLLPALHRVAQLVNTPAAIALLGMSEGEAAVVAEPTLPPKKRRPTRPPMSDSEFSALTRWFEVHAGLLITPEARARVEARLGIRLDATGRADFSHYRELLEKDAGERSAAVEALTVHETYFFREPVSLEGFRDEIIPHVATRGRPLRVWSAGCSTGEEPFTIATLLEQARARGDIDDYEVLGTDVSPRAIARAKDAHYVQRSFRQPLTAADRAFFVESEQGLSPVDRLRARTRFDVLNLIDPDAVARLPRFDVVFCRNVLIYFSGAARRVAVEAFHSRLRPGGVLVLGHSESLLHVENPFEPWTLKRGLVYRRSES